MSAATVTANIASIADIVRVHSVDRPSTTALVVDDCRITFAELAARTNRAAQAFAAAGVGFGDRVAFIGKNSAEYFDVTIALAKLGAVGVAVNWRLAAPEMLHIINDATARVVVVGAEFFGHVEQIAQHFTHVQTIVAVGPHGSWPEFTDWIAQYPAIDPGVVTGPDDIAMQLYTSGTTGLPKGAMLTNRNLFATVDGAATHWRLDSASVNLAVMPMFHIAGAGTALVGMYAGCTTVVMRDVDPAAILRAIREHRITNVLLVPAVIQFLLLTPGVDETDFSSLRTIVYGASPISDDVLVKALQQFGCDMIQVYGSTETTGPITQLDAADHDPRLRPHLLRSCGKPFPWVEVRIVDSDGRDVADGEVGELWTRSSQNMAGYWNMPVATADTITSDGWLKTGDAGYRGEDGYIYLYDRVKDMIVSGGENVYPVEVENVLMTHPAVRDVAVIGVPDQKWGEAVKAVVVAVGDPDSAQDLEGDLLAYARQQLAGYKLPKSVDFVCELPRNPTGKILKRQLREPYWDHTARRIG